MKGFLSSNKKQKIKKETPSRGIFERIRSFQKRTYHSWIQRGKKYFSFSGLRKLTKHSLNRLKRIPFWYIVIVLSLLNIILFLSGFFIYNQISHFSLQNLQSKNIHIQLPVLSQDIQTDTTARALVVYDPQTRVVVYGKNNNFRFSPASTTKIMTATIVLEKYKLDDVLAADGVSSVEGSKMGLFEGEQMTVKDLLYGLMLPSGNDAAYVFATHYPGGYTAFVKEMNKKAKELFLENTHYVDPAGLQDENYSTASDMARLAAYAMKNPLFREIVKTKEITVYNTNYTIPHVLKNLNELLEIPGINGVKTGFTEEAGQVLVTSYTYQGRNYIIVVLKSNDRFADTEKIMQEVISKIKLASY